MGSMQVACFLASTTKENRARFHKVPTHTGEPIEYPLEYPLEYLVEYRIEYPIEYSSRIPSSTR